jgi:glycosyltransferase involved in cell wall biosynthesis
MDDILVSVIMPCFNQGKYIDEAIQSVLSSKYTNFEIIVINDGSTDPFTIKVLTTKTWNKTCVYNIPNGGVANARNFGIRESKGKYILPLDADDKISPNFIDQAVSILEKNPAITIVCCEVEMFGVKKGKYPLPEHSLEMILGQNTMVVSSMFRKSDFTRTIGYNPNMKSGFEDWDFWLSLLELGGHVKKIYEVGFYYRIKRGTRNNSINQTEFGNLRKQLYENHKSIYSKFFFDPTKSFEYDMIKNSKEYRLGKVLLTPLRVIYNLINKH